MKKNQELENAQVTNQDSCVLIGFPYDIGAERSNILQGQKFGPFQMRRFNPHLFKGKNVNKIELFDHGNIKLDKENIQLEDLVQKLRIEVKNIKDQNRVPIVIGGTKECSTACFDDVDLVISFINIPDVGLAYDNNKLSMTSGNRVSQINNCVYMAYDDNFLQSQDKDYIKNYEKYTLKDIRSIKLQKSQDSKQPNTQAGQMLKQFLLNRQEQKIHLSFSMEVIDSAFCPGVSRQNNLGLCTEEAVEIFWQAGNEKRIVSVDITDYNPMKEDQRSGTITGSLIYNFLLAKA